MKYKLLAVDLDGTALNDIGEFGEANTRAIKKLMELGVNVVISTGRANPSIEKFLSTKFFDYAICANGAAIYSVSDDTVIFEQKLEKNIARDILRETKKLGITAQALIDKTYFLEAMTERLEQYYQKNSVPHEVRDFDSIGDVTKILALGETSELEQFKAHIQKRYVNRVNSFFSSKTYLEFVHKDVNKGMAVLKLADMLGIDRAETITAGDNYNDIEMIEAGGMSVAPRNAVGQIKGLAKYVCKRSNDEGIIEEILHKFF